MKTYLVFALLFVAGTADAQSSLKDLLYSGKLKNDNKSVVRNTDDLTTKIDTSTRRPEPVVEAPAATALVVRGDSIVAVQPATPVTATSVPATTDAATSVTGEAPAPVAAAPTGTKSNTRLWKDYTDSLGNVLKAEVFTNKKIKEGTYTLTVDYELGVDGVVNVTNVVSTPGNAILQAAVKDRMENDPLRLAPNLDSSGKPKAIKRRQNFTVTK